MWETLAYSYLETSKLIAQQQSALTFLASTAIVGGVGAYFGALAAQRIVRQETRLRRRNEAIMAANAAHSLTIVVFNQAAALKKQHYLPLLNTWTEQRERVISASKGATNQEISVPIDLQTPPPVVFPITALAEIVYSKLSLNGRPLAALSELVQAEHTLSVLVEDHKSLREEFSEHERDYVIPRYLALETLVGTDARYRDFVQGSLAAIDDLIYFTDVLARKIHGELADVAQAFEIA